MWKGVIIVLCMFIAIAISIPRAEEITFSTVLVVSLIGLLIGYFITGFASLAIGRIKGNGENKEANDIQEKNEISNNDQDNM